MFPIIEVAVARLEGVAQHPLAIQRLLVHVEGDRDSVAVLAPHDTLEAYLFFNSSVLGPILNKLCKVDPPTLKAAQPVSVPIRQAFALSVPSSFRNRSVTKRYIQSMQKRLPLLDLEHDSVVE